MLVFALISQVALQALHAAKNISIGEKVPKGVE